MIATRDRGGGARQASRLHLHAIEVDDMAAVTNDTNDVIRVIHDLDEGERASAFRRWVQLSELVAPRREREGAPQRSAG